MQDNTTSGRNQIISRREVLLFLYKCRPRSPVSNLLYFLQNQNPNFTTGPDRRLNAGRGDRDDWKMHPFTKVRGNFCRLPPFHRLTPPCPFGAGAAGDARGGEVDPSKHDLLQVGLKAIMGIFKLTFGVHLWHSIDTLEMGILLIQIHSRFALGPY